MIDRKVHSGFVRPPAEPNADDIKSSVDEFLETNPVTPGASAEEAAQIKLNTENIEKLQTLSEGLDTVVISDSAPNTDNKCLWIQSGQYESFDIPQINDETVSEEDTWSSKKISDELNAQVSQLSEEISYLKENGTVTVVSSVEPETEDIPKIFFDEAIPQTKDDVVTKFRYISKTLDFEGYAEFKAQGNSSMNYAKKNMTVKMYKDEALEEKLKVDFRGWGKQNKHVYKANWIDLLHARNVVSARIWADIVKSRANYLSLPELLRTSPNQGAVDGFPVKVYSQGIYQGRYTLNIPKDAWMANMDNSLNEHCILCGENYTSGCFRALANINGNDWTDEIHDTVPTSIKTRWNEVIAFVMNSTDEEFKANLGNYFFVDSLIDYFIFGMVSCGLDAFGKNQLYFTYDGTKWIASMYDMDSTWGLWWNGSQFVSSNYARTEFQDFKDGQGNLLYIRLVNLFYEEIKARYEVLKNGALSIPNIINHFERFTDIAPLDLVKEDYASTTGGGRFTGIPSQSTNNIQQIRQYVIDRYVYCDEYFASLTPVEPVPATGITLDKTTLTFTDSVSQTITAIVEPSNTTDVIVWSSDNEGIATVANGVVTPIGKGSCTITAIAGNVSATCEVTVDVEEIVTYTITRNLIGCSSSSDITSINEGSAYTETITLDTGYIYDGATISITMGETDISSSFVNGVLTIDSVTGDIVISISAVMSTEPLYPLVNAEKVIQTNTITITNGNHVKINKIAGTQGYLPISDITVLADDASYGDANNNIFRKTNFTLSKGDVIKIIKSNTAWSAVGYEASQSQSSSIVFAADTGEVKFGIDKLIGLDYELSNTVSADCNVDGLRLWHASSGSFIVEFDLEVYVNGVRYV